ncbi:hypothetical protein OAB00_01470 [Akkermansiaceae bacterium]|nr:hypothetical protein [Akkermansiaceae bacterium]
MKNTIITGSAFALGVALSAGIAISIVSQKPDSTSVLKEKSPTKTDTEKTSEPQFTLSSSQISQLKVYSGAVDYQQVAEASAAISKMDSSQLQSLLTELDASSIGYNDLKGEMFLYNAFSRLASIDPAKALESLDSLEPRLRAVASNVLFEQWAKSDPTAALIEAQERKDDAGIAGVLLELASADPQNALSISKKHGLVYGRDKLLITVAESAPELALTDLLENGDKTTWIADSIAAGWASRDPQAALSYLSSLDKDKNTTHLVKGIVKGLSAENPELAFNLLSEYVTELSSRDIVDASISLASADPDRALAFAASVTDPEKRSAILMGAITGVLDENPDQAFTLWSDKIGEMNGKNLSDLSRTLGAKDARKTLEILSSLPKNSVDAASMNVIADWMDSDADKAIAYFNGIQDKELQSTLALSAYRTLSERDPQRFLTLYANEGGMIEQGMENTLIRDAVSRLAKSDIEAAKAQVAAFATGDLKKSAIFGVAEELSKVSMEKSLQFVNDLPDSTDKNEVIGGLYYMAAKKDPDKVLELMEANNFQPQGEFSLSSLIDVYSFKNPSKATELVHKITDPKESSVAAGQLAAQWARKSPVEAAQWVNSLEDGSTRDSAAYSLAKVFSYKQPDYAMEWAASISEPQLRDQELSGFFQNWKRSDPMAAQQWLDSNELLTPKEFEMLNQQ